MPESQRRLFFALWPDRQLRAQLVDLGDRMAPPAARRVPAANLHLTLAFLGAVAESRLPAVLACAGALRHQPVAFTLARIETWPRPRILCLTGGDGHDAPAGLAAALATELARTGLPAEAQPFRAHVTLARKVHGRPPAMPLADPVGWHADRFCLVESRTLAEGARYTPLAEWRL